MKKVLHIVRKFLPPTATFIRNQVINHIQYEPHILYAEDVKGTMPTEIKALIPCTKAINGIFGNLLYKKLRIITAPTNRKTVRYINELKPDLIHVHYGVDMLIFSRVLKSINIPVVVSFYGYDCTAFPKRFNGLAKYWMQKRVFGNKNLKTVFAMSSDMEKDLVSIGCPKNLIKIHYYGSETLSFNQERKYPEKDYLNFTIISGLYEKKGHLILLEAWKSLFQSNSEKVSLKIYGSGDMKEEIKAFINDNSLKSVTLCGPIQYGSEQHHEVLSSADVFVHPSITAQNGDKEGVPGAIIEAMASGLPVISTFHAGIPSVIEHGTTGYLVEERNVKQLAAAINLIADNRALREKIGSNARIFAITSLNVKIKEIELEHFYDDAIHTKQTIFA